jgi:hypothetical protein
MAAGKATEVGLIGSVSLLTMAAHCTGPAGVARIDRDDQHTHLLRLVAEKASKLPKRPTVARTSLLTPNCYSLPNSLQVFDREGLACRARLVNEPLADAVVDIPLEAAFLAGKLPQPPAGAAGVGALEPLAVPEAAFSYPLDIRAAVGLPVAVSSEVHDPHVNAQEADRLVGCGIRLGLRDVQVELPVTLHQLRPTELPARVIQMPTLKLCAEAG